MDNQSDSRELWKIHLQAENCVGIRKLLIAHGHDLLTEGWSEVESEVAISSSLKFKPARVWKGRTALHVAVRRGDVKLVEYILNISYPLPSASVASKEYGSINPWDPRPDPRNHLLEVIDNDYELDALAMAVVNGSNHIVNLLKEASLRCGWNPYDISDDRVDDENMDRRLSAEDKDIKRLAETLSKVTRVALLVVTQSETWNKDVTIESMKNLYRENCDFNFIDIDLDMHLFFHSTFCPMPGPMLQVAGAGNLMKLIRREIISQVSEIDGLLEFLLVTLKDGQGRTALHAAVDYNNVDQFRFAMRSLAEKKIDKRKVLNAKDSAGRTPLYRAAAKSLPGAMGDLLDDTSTDIHAKIKFDAQMWGDLGIDIEKVSWNNGFRSDYVYVPQTKLDRKGFNLENISQDGTVVNHLETISSTALHVAIIHHHEDMVEKILYRLKYLQANNDGHESSESCWPECIRRFSWPVAKVLQADAKASYRKLRATTTQLAVLVGSVPILQSLLEAEATWTNFDDNQNFQSFLLAAASGNPALIPVFLDSNGGTFDYTVCDALGNTALHHALMGRPVQVLPHLLDFVGCQHVYSSRWNSYASELPANPQEEVQRDHERSNQEVPQEAGYVQRGGTINLLLEAGIDIWAKNQAGRTASPGREGEKFFGNWWYNTVADKTKQEQKKLNHAANTITVTAALVATASYVGPLTPPLGSSDGDALRLNILPVRIFAISDSLSFYFAVAAIMLTLVLALPLRKKSKETFRDLERTRVLVAISVSFLFPSIVCVLVAFTTGYVAASPDDGLWQQGLTVATIVGVFCCFVVIIKTSMRLKEVLEEVLGKSFLRKGMKLFFEMIFECCKYKLHTYQRRISRRKTRGFANN